MGRFTTCLVLIVSVFLASAAAPAADSGRPPGEPLGELAEVPREMPPAVVEARDAVGRDEYPQQEIERDLDRGIREQAASQGQLWRYIGYVFAAFAFWVLTMALL